MDATDTTIDVGPEIGRVSALRLDAPQPRAAFVFAHGAGAGMRHTFMADLAAALAERGVSTLRYQFPGMQRGSKRPDPPPVAHATVRAAVAAARQHWPTLPLVAGGKSFGGRMTSQAHAATPLEGVAGLVFVGFPLHPAGQPGTERAAHLRELRCPLLFLQGTRDALAELTLLQPLVASLAPHATLSVFNDADHAFHVRARSGTTDALTLAAMADVMALWVAQFADVPA